LKLFENFAWQLPKNGIEGSTRPMLETRPTALLVFPNGVNSQDTSAETGLDLPLEIARLLLIDVVGYSKLLVNEKIELLQELNHILHCFRVPEAIGVA
jgi:hypothetical protein